MIHARTSLRSSQSILTAIVAPALVLGMLVAGTPAHAAPAAAETPASAPAEQSADAPTAEDQVEPIDKAEGDIPFENAPIPTISSLDGKVVVGASVHVANIGDWRPGAHRFEYQWLRDGKAISERATGRSYIPAPEDEGAQLSVRLTGSRDGYRTTVRTSATRLVEPAPPLLEFETTSKPRLLGSRYQGRLWVEPGTWSPQPDAFTVHWLRDGKELFGATQYDLGEWDIGRQISARVTARKEGYRDVVMVTDPVIGEANKTNFPLAPDPTIVILDGGQARVGGTLFATLGTWNPGPENMRYQWYRGTSPIAGANSASYTPVIDDQGRDLRVQVTAWHEAHWSETRLSPVVRIDEIDPSLQDFATAPAPTIAGAAVAGATLTAQRGAWSPAAETYSYQWSRNGHPIEGATGADFEVRQIDAGQRISVWAIAKRAGYRTAMRASDPISIASAELFANAPTPTVTGSAKVGAMVTVRPGAWEPTPGSFAYQWYRGATAIEGETGVTYTYTSEDEGEQISVRVTASRPGYAPTTRVSAQRKIGPADPVLLDFTTAPAPTITGTPQVGGALIAQPGAWAPGPDALSYQWLRNGAAIPDATSSAYSLVALDQGAQLSVRLTANKSGYRETVRSSAAQPVQPSDAARQSFDTAPNPTMSVFGGGGVRVGSVVRVEPGTWSPQPSSFAYQWERNGIAIPGADSSVYVPIGADQGRELTVRITGHRNGYYDTVRVSSPATVLASNTDLLDFTTAPDPTISVEGGGDAQVGKPLTVRRGAWTPAPTHYDYQWERNGIAIPGANALSYTPVAADANTQLRVWVTASMSGYRATIRSSALLTIRPAAEPGTRDFTTTPVPTISGELRVGATVTAVPGTWHPSPDAFTYRWLRDGEEIDDATSAVYTLTDDDASTAVSVRVTASKEGYRPATTNSVARGVLPADPEIEHFTAAPIPSISGTVRVGSQVTVQPGVWQPTPSALEFQWERNGAVIPNATAGVYTPVADDAGTTLRVRVTATKNGFHDTVRLSEGQTVAGAGTELLDFVQAPAPGISGIARVHATLTAAPGAWEPIPDGFSYQWLREGEPIPGATAAAYSPVPSDEGTGIALRITATKSGYAPTTRTSSERQVLEIDPTLSSFATAPSPTVVVSGGGQVRVGASLTAVPGDWAPAPDHFEYQWERNGIRIPGATSVNYTSAPADADKHLAVWVTAVKAGYRTTMRVSTGQQVAAETTGLLEFTTAPTPTVSGAPRVGTRLTAAPGFWAPAPDSLAYQWLRDGIAITGATSSGYTPVAADAGKRLQVRIAAVRAGYVPTERTSAALTVAAATPVVLKLTATPKPKIGVVGGGKAKVSKKLAVKAGTWKPAKVTLKYRWLRNGKAIKGATKSKYKITKKDRGKRISVRVTGTKKGYVTVTKTSSSKRIPKAR